MSDYSSWSYMKILRECKTKGFTVEKTRPKRIELINFLEGHTQTKNTSSSSSIKLLPQPFVEVDSSESDDSGESSDEEEERKYLACGLPKDTKINIPYYNIEFTGVRNEESDSSKWIDITINKNTPKRKYSGILVNSPSLFFTSGNKLDERKLSTFLDILADEGCLHVPCAKTGYISVEFQKALESRGINISSKIEFKVNNRNRKFYVYRRCEEENDEFKPRATSDKISLNKIAAASSYHPKDEGAPKLRPPGEYSLIDISLNIARDDRYASIVNTRKRININFQEFLEVLHTPEFMESFIQNLKELYKHKIKFYSIKLEETKKEFSRIDAKIKKLRAKGVDDKIIKEMYPMFDFYAGFIVELEELIETITTKYTEDLEAKKIQSNILNSLQDPVKGLTSIIGRDSVKDSIASQLYAFSKSYKTMIGSFNNICLMGHAGSGKTHIAKVLGHVYSQSGILVTSTVKIISRADLVGQYIGQTAPRTRATLLETLEGVLFIDEAYQLTPKDAGRDFGSEAITEIVNFLDKYIGMNIIMVAGYEDLMKSNFFPANEGLSRRFPHRLILHKYTTSELTDILIRFIEFKSDVNISERVGNWLYSTIHTILTKFEHENVLSNQAGDMLNLGASIVKNIYAAYHVDWSDESAQKHILMEGLREFLYMKNLYV